MGHAGLAPVTICEEGVIRKAKQATECCGVGDGTQTRDNLLGRQGHTLRLLNKLTVTELAKLSGLSKSYIAQVKYRKCPPSQRLLEAIANQLQPNRDYLALFLQSREAMGVTPHTLDFYKDRLDKYTLAIDYVRITRAEIQGV